jgi:uncharacterized protein YlxW (UPF0749 family)
MLILGLLLILGSAALGVGLAYNGSEAASVQMLGTTVETTAAGLFFSGAATMLVFLVGVWLLSSKLGRARRKRTERNAARRDQRDSVKQLEAERTQLAAENERLSERLDTQPNSQPGTGGSSPTAVDLRDEAATAAPTTGKHA